MKRIVVSGYYGAKNAGDEAMLAAMLEVLGDLDPELHITVISANPADTERRHGVHAVGSLDARGIFRAMRHADLLISGGGSLLQNVTSRRSLYYYMAVILLAFLLGKRTMLYAQGIGPVTGKFACRCMRWLGNRVSLITVRDEGTDLEFPLQLRMERGDTGWRVVRVTNYRAYLEAVQKAAASNLGRYIDATRPIVDRYNGVFRSKQREFRNLTETGRSTYTTVYRKSLTHLLQEDMIPLLKKYQKELDGVDVPHGAQYLAAQRKAATEAFIGAYESFVKGLNGGTTEDFARAETLHKMALTYDLRVGDMIRRGAVSAETPATP